MRDAAEVVPANIINFPTAALFYIDCRCGIGITSQIFNVSVDYIIGEGELAALDKDLLKRIEDIEKLDEATKEHLFFLIDNVIQNYKTKKAFNNRVGR